MTYIFINHPKSLGRQQVQLAILTAVQILKFAMSYKMTVLSKKGFTVCLKQRLLMKFQNKVCSTDESTND